MISLLSVLIYSTAARVVDFTGLLYPLTSWPEPVLPQCNSYLCDTDPPSWASINSTCIRSNATGHFLLNPCNNPQRQQSYCPPLFDITLAQVSNCTLPDLQYPALFPNERGCSTGAGCVGGGVCVDNVCVGANITNSCTSNIGCNPGLRCVNGDCMVLLNKGEAGCTSDEDCVNTCGCDRNAFTSEYGTCVRYFSISVGQPVHACNQFNSLLCESGQCVTDPGTYNSTCVKAFTSANEMPVQCQSNTECYAAGNGINVFTECSCGLNPNKHSFCQPFLGDLPGQNLLKQLNVWINSEFIAGCNTGRRFDWLCMKDWATAKADLLNLALTHYSMYPQLQENDECVQRIYTYQYYEALQAITRDSASALMGSFVLLGLL